MEYTGMLFGSIYVIVLIIIVLMGIGLLFTLMYTAILALCKYLRS